MGHKFAVVIAAGFVGLIPALTVGTGPAAAREYHPWCVGHLGRIPIPPPVLGAPASDCHGKGKWPGWRRG